VDAPESQYRYQVRFDWAVAGAVAVGGGADVVVWVDVFGTPDPLAPASVERAERGEAATGMHPLSGSDPLCGVGSLPGTDPLHGAVPAAAVVAGGLRNRTAVADWVLARQAEKGGRFTVAVIGAGDVRADGSLRFTVEDLLAAGAVIDALAAVGIDYCSPEAAAATAAFTSLTRATGHLVSASGSGQRLIDAGRRADVDAAVEIDVSDTVPVLREAVRS
jgi:2-phosphosulfolactate phosphatase